MQRYPTTACLIVAAVLLGVSASGCSSETPATDRTPKNPLTLDWRAGHFDRLALNMQVAEAKKRLGPGVQDKNVAQVPLGEDGYEIGGPDSFGAPCPGFYKFNDVLYRGLAVFGCDRIVFGWVTTSRRSQTPEGVGVGDSWGDVYDRYPQADCYIANRHTEYVEYPNCVVQVCKGRTLWFGGNPIRSIYLLAEKRYGLERCARPELSEWHARFGGTLKRSALFILDLPPHILRLNLKRIRKNFQKSG